MPGNNKSNSWWRRLWDAAATNTDVPEPYRDEVVLHRLLFLLLPALEQQGMALSPDRYIRLKRLILLAPPEMKSADWRPYLCPVFATDAVQQHTFNTLFDRALEQLEAQPTAEPERPESKKQTSDAPEVTDRTAPPTSPPPPTSLQKQPGSAGTRRPLVVDLDECTDPPYSWNIVPENEEVPLEISPVWGKTVLQLRRRETVDFALPDLPGSVRATIAEGGVPVFRYRYPTRPAEYLMLVERHAIDDHRAALFDLFYRSLHDNEVFIERFFYSGDLRVCRNERHPAGLNLAQLRYRYPDAHLVVIGSGYRFLSPKTGEPAPWMQTVSGWRRRVLLTPVSQHEWGQREQALRSLFSLLPASFHSLHFLSGASEETLHGPYDALPEYIRRIAEAQALNIPEPALPALRQQYDPGVLCWIAACAVYPALHFNLTMQIGRLLSDSLGYQLATTANLLALARLPWFTTGQIPAPIRTELLEYLERRHPEQHRQVISYLHELLEKNPPPENSVAWAEHQVNLALLKVMRDPTPDVALLTQLRSVIKRLDRPEKRGDFVLPASWETLLERIGGLDITGNSHQNDGEYEDGETLQVVPTRTPVRIAILTPLRMEYEAVRTQLPEWKDEVFGGRIYANAHLEGMYHTYEIRLCETGPGNTVVALATQRVVDLFQPTLVFLVGIAGGVKDAGIGDIVIGTKAYGYESGKETDSGLLARPNVLPFSHALVEAARMLSRSDQWRTRMPGGGASANIYFGPIASGSKVIASTKSVLYGYLKEQYNDTLALEMESIGFAQAAQPYRSVHALNIRVVSDLLDLKSEGDEAARQRRAAERAAAFAFELLYQSDFTSLIKPDTTINDIVKDIFTLLLPAILSGDADNENRDIWAKIKPLLSEETKEKLAQKSNAADAQAWVLNDLKRGLENNNQLLENLAALLNQLRSGKINSNIDQGNNVTQIRNGDSYRDLFLSGSGHAPEMIFVDGGEFLMGSEDSESYGDEKPVHGVRVNDFYMGKYPVTVEEYMMFAEETGSHFPEWLEEGSDYNIRTGKDDYYKKLGEALQNKQNPIVGISWNDAVAFCEWLSQKTGRMYRLPSEAEWEYAARGGTRSKGFKYAGSNNLDEVAWHSGNSKARTLPVGLKKTNELGLYDMSGNVREWCADDWHSDYNGAPTDGSAWADSPDRGGRRVYRGGGWRGDARRCRVSYRGGNAPADRYDDLGFRLVLSP